ncbi:NUDIX hydrolase domain-like protein [Scheffersomyces amazonensis]|uniref:NUDIX hydrolase domain-like protein n=1 Tax=Scheffersomyces amazonensis TaxID=1078765 RepID=UPI00315C9CC7
MTQVKRLKYTLGFVYCRETNQILLLNRTKSPWMGKWNGVGGKLDVGESPYECITREAQEETGLYLTNWQGKGAFTWEVYTTQKGNNSSESVKETGGLYLFIAEVTKQEVDEYKTPITYCKEGILDWKSLDWILHEENLGIGSFPV